LLLLYLGSLAGLLLIVAGVVRGVYRAGELADMRSRLMVLAESIGDFPLPSSSSEADLQEARKDFSSIHQELEWFPGHTNRPLARLGELHNIGPLPKRTPNKKIYWQDGKEWLAIVRPVDAAGLDFDGKPKIWLRVSESLERTEVRSHQLDLALAVAVVVAFVLSAAASIVLTRKAVQPLEIGLRRLRQFSLDASHELRGPLAAMAANAEMGLLDGTSDPNRQRRRFESIASATAQMEGLVEDLLLLARQDEGRLDHPRPLDLGKLLHEQLDLHRDGFALRQQTLEVGIEPRLMVLGQATLLQRLVRNLLENAQRYTPAGGTVTVEASRRGNTISVSIADTGMGLTPEQLPRVFERFWRASADRSQGGSGLGLAIAHRISLAHGGSIRVTSQQGVGSRFLVELPALPQHRSVE
jgi:signal transduction histidine kinase